MNSRRLLTALIIITIAYLYFRYIGFEIHGWGHLIFGALIFGSLLVAFLTRKKDITIGILYGLLFVLCSLMFLFVFFVNV